MLPRRGQRPARGGGNAALSDRGDRLAGQQQRAVGGLRRPASSKFQQGGHGDVMGSWISVAARTCRSARVRPRRACSADDRLAPTCRASCRAVADRRTPPASSSLDTCGASRSSTGCERANWRTARPRASWAARRGRSRALPLQPAIRGSSPRPCRSGTGGIRSGRSTSARGALSFSRMQRRQLQVRAQHPGGPAGVVALPVRRQRGEEVGLRPPPSAASRAASAPVPLARRCARRRAGSAASSPARRRRHALQRVAVAQLRSRRATPARSALRARSRSCGTPRRWRRPAPLGARTRAPAACCSSRHCGAGRANGSQALEARSGAAARARCRRRSAPPRSRSCRRRSRGRTAAPSSARPRQPAAASIAAASVSFSGASPLSSRQPRLNSGSPERVDVQRRVVGGRGAARARRSGRCVSTLGRSPAASRSGRRPRP